MKFALAVLFSVLSVPALANTFSQDVISELQVMRGVFAGNYAPAEWKKQYTGYDLDTEYKKAVAAVRGKSTLTRRDANDILKNFIYAMKDYHTSISFVSTEQAILPFVVRGAGSKYFIVYIDRDKLPASTFPFKVGDELVNFDGKPAAQAVAEVQAEIPANVATTDKALAELTLTSRKGARGYKVPHGPVTITVKTATGLSSRQLIWDYTPEEVADRSPLDEIFKLPKDKLPESTLFNPQMDVDFLQINSFDNPYGLGTQKSFTPDLGEKSWSSSAKDFFYAYTYKSPAGKTIGYIRIASYEAPDYMKAVEEFGKVIARFQDTTDAMVIDQVNNPGGSVFYLYALASMLSADPLTTPRHRFTITQSDVAGAANVANILKNIRSDADVHMILPESAANGYPISYEYVQFTLNYARFIVSEWNAGRRLTNPNWIGGVDHVNPAAVHYTKPILLLTNELDFSGGDFFPAIMQDNKRVTILGTRTAGAGGYVNDVDVPNAVGVDKFRCTGSIAERADLNPIENLGVKPDIDYPMTEKDLSDNYSSYVKAIVKAADDLASKAN